VSVLVCFADVRREVDGVAELDEVLDGLAGGGDPVLVELIGGAAVMNLGVGLRDAAVVLFRDPDGRPWCARSGDGSPIVTETDLEFAKNGTRYQFFALAAIAPSEMREAAREFVRIPGARPSVLTWVPEGIDADTIEGDKRGP
jgi:hypothetical protein